MELEYHLKYNNQYYKKNQLCKNKKNKKFQQLEVMELEQNLKYNIQYNNKKNQLCKNKKNKKNI